jgi:hypothetical protein
MAEQAIGDALVLDVDRARAGWKAAIAVGNGPETNWTASLAAALAGVVGRQVGVLLLDALPAGIAASLLAGALAAVVSAVGFGLALAVLDRRGLAVLLDRLPGRAKLVAR